MIITLSGEIGAGKDTFAEILIDAFSVNGYTAEVVKFAEPIREVALKLGFAPDDRETKEVALPYSFTHSDLQEACVSVFQFMCMEHRVWLALKVWEKVVNSPTAKKVSTRQFMQWLGMAARDIRQDYFVHHLQHACEVKVNTVSIVSDCRFVNEVEVGDTHIHVLRADNPLRVTTTDLSEAAQDKLKDAAEFLVHNEERIDWREELEDKAHYIVHTIGWRGYLDETITN